MRLSSLHFKMNANDFNGLYKTNMSDVVRIKCYFTNMIVQKKPTSFVANTKLTFMYDKGIN